MTGAPMPEGADAVVQVELTGNGRRGDGSDRACRPCSRAERVAAGHIDANWGRRAANGAMVRPIEIAILAEMGHAEVLMTPRPRVAILPTGNELVAVDEKPAAGQIRNSNGPMLLAAAAACRGGCDRC